MKESPPQNNAGKLGTPGPPPAPLGIYFLLFPVQRVRLRAGHAQREAVPERSVRARERLAAIVTTGGRVGGGGGRGADSGGGGATHSLGVGINGITTAPHGNGQLLDFQCPNV